MARGRHEPPSPKGLFLWHKEDSHSGQASLISPHCGVWKGVWGTWAPFRLPKFVHVHPVFRVSHGLCVKYPLRKIEIFKKEKRRAGFKPGCLRELRSGGGPGMPVVLSNVQSSQLAMLYSRWGRVLGSMSWTSQSSIVSLEALWESPGLQRGWTSL